MLPHSHIHLCRAPLLALAQVITKKVVDWKSQD
jgi:hypothetical protein